MNFCVALHTRLAADFLPPLHRPAVDLVAALDTDPMQSALLSRFPDHIPLSAIALKSNRPALDGKYNFSFEINLIIKVGHRGCFNRCKLFSAMLLDHFSNTLGIIQRITSLLFLTLFLTLFTIRIFLNLF